MNLLTPVLLLLLVLSGGFSEVVNSFTQTCPEFFAKPRGTVSPPTVFTEKNYKQICQVRSNRYEYATLYDTDNRIPVYSAYKFEDLKQCNRNNNWYIEPQLEDRGQGKAMNTEGSVKQSIQHQAINKDYEGTSKHGYDKGHLAPVLHASSQSCSDATFTLTNAAPQDSSFNRGQWRMTEEYVADTLEKDCSVYSKYIVTGVVPGNNKPLNDRVRIPSHFWTAYCCIDNYQVKASRGFIGENSNEPVQSMTVEHLETVLTNLYNKGTFRVFGGNSNEISFTLGRSGPVGGRQQSQTLCHQYETVHQMFRFITEHQKHLREKYFFHEE